MQYKVIADFNDLKDGGFQYRVGVDGRDIYPADGQKKPTQSRIKNLMSSNNKRGIPLIEPIPEPPQED